MIYELWLIIYSFQFLQMFEEFARIGKNNNFRADANLNFYQL